MGDKERILVVEGYAGLQDELREILQGDGHEVVGVAHNLARLGLVLDRADQFRLAIVGGCLRDLRVGAVAAMIIKHQRPDTIIISHSDSYQTFGDYHVNTQDPLYPQVLLDTIKGIE